MKKYWHTKKARKYGSTCKAAMWRDLNQELHLCLQEKIQLVEELEQQALSLTRVTWLLVGHICISLAK